MDKKISDKLKEGRFIQIVKQDKKPHGTGDWNNKTVDWEEANKFLADGYNVGLVAGQNIIVVDADKPESVEYCDKHLPLTYTEETCSGGRHYIYKVNDDIENTLIGNDMGEIRCKRQYVVIAPSQAKNKSNIVSEYKVVRDVSINIITPVVLNNLLIRFSPVENKGSKRMVQKKTNKEQLQEEVVKRMGSYMKDLITNEKTKEELQLLGFPSRSERDCKIITHLLNRGFGQYIKSIFEQFPCGDKYREHNAPDKYLNKTIDDSISFLGLRTQDEIQLEMDIEMGNPIWLKRHLDKFLIKISEVKDNTNLFVEGLIAILAFRLKLSQKKLEKRVKELIEENTPKKLISLSTLSSMELTPQEYWVEPILPKGVLVIIGAKPGEGKSLFVQGLTTSLLTTNQFLGYPCPNKKPRVLLYYIDDSSESMLLSRHHFILNGLKLHPEFDENGLKKCDTSFTFNKHNLNKEIEFALNYDIIVLDSYRRVLKGTENDSETTDAFFNDFLKPLKEAKKTVVVIHHLRKTNLDEISDDELQDSFRGSGDVAAQVDLAYILRTNQTESLAPMVEAKDCILKVVKNRLGLSFRDMKGHHNNNVCYRVIKDSNKTSTTFEYLDPSIVKTPKERRLDDILLLVRDKGPITRQQIVKEISRKFSVSSILVEKDIDTLHKSGEIFKEKYGSYSLRKGLIEDKEK